VEVLDSGAGELFHRPDPDKHRAYVREHRSRALVNKVMTEQEAVSKFVSDIASMCWRTIIHTTQERRKFVKKMDFITSPGYLDGSPGARERAGLPAGSGPYRVVTPEAVFGFDEQTRDMKLLAIAEWVEAKDVLEKMDFEPMLAEKIEILEPPTEEELEVLRTYVDPRGGTIGEGKWINL